MTPLLRRAGIEPEAAFDDPESRQLRFTTNHPNLSIIRVRAFDAATFVAFGAAHLGVVGNDVLMEFDYPDIYSPLDLGIGRCRLAVAEPEEIAGDDDPGRWSHIRIATKYPEITRRHFAERGVQAECIKLNGAMELAPALVLCRRIVDLVSKKGTDITGHIGRKVIAFIIHGENNSLDFKTCVKAALDLVNGFDELTNAFKSVKFAL